MADAAIFTRSQIKWLLRLARVSGSLSMVGSSLIVRAVLSDRKNKLSKPYHRILLCMSFVDIIGSAALMAGTSAMPKGSPGTYDISIGNMNTCVAQGFFLQLFLAVPLYNLFLSYYYVLTIKYSWSERKIKKKFEPIVHVVALGFPIVTAISGVFLGIFNPIRLGCWIGPNPIGCDDDMTCIRGANANKYVYLFAGVWTLLIFVLLPVNMALVYCTVRKQVKKMKKYSQRFLGPDYSSESTSNITSTERSSSVENNATPPSKIFRRPTIDFSFRRSSIDLRLDDKSIDTRRRPLSRKRIKNKQIASVARQASLYVLFYFAVFIWPTILHLGYQFLPGKDEKRVWLLMVATNVLYPLQGLWNFIIYIGPVVAKIKNNHPDWTYFSVVIAAMFSPNKNTPKLLSRRRYSAQQKSSRQNAHVAHHDEKRPRKEENYKSQNLVNNERIPCRKTDQEICIGQCKPEIMLDPNCKDINKRCVFMHATGNEIIAGGDIEIIAEAKNEKAKRSQSWKAIDFPNVPIFRTHSSGSDYSIDDSDYDSKITVANQEAISPNFIERRESPLYDNNLVNDCGDAIEIVDNEIPLQSVINFVS